MKNFQAQNIQEMDIMKRSNLQMAGKEEGDETQTKGTENIVNSHRKK